MNVQYDNNFGRNIAIITLDPEDREIVYEVREFLSEECGWSEVDILHQDMIAFNVRSEAGYIAFCDDFTECMAEYDDYEEDEDCEF